MNKIHFISHHFSEWDSQTKHMNRLEKSIFMDLRTLYFASATANNGRIDAIDTDLLHYRLACHTEEEQQALARLLKDQFKKIGKTYRNSEWDSQIKNIHWAMKNGKYGNEVGNVPNNETGNKLGNVGNGLSNENGNALSNAERQAKLKAERKKLLSDLANVGIKLDRNAKISDIREQHNQHYQQTSNDFGNENELGNVGNGLSNENGNESNAQNQANIITTNQDQNQESVQISENPQNFNAHTQIYQTSIQTWQAPNLDTMRSILMENDFAGVFTQEIYDQILPKFKNHFENLEISENKRLATEQSRIDRLVTWIKREKTTQQQPATPNTPAKPIDPSKSVLLNGIHKPCFPNMSQQQTFDFVKMHVVAYESMDETYDRLATQTDWTAFDYDGFNQRYTTSDKAVA